MASALRDTASEFDATSVLGSTLIDISNRAKWRSPLVIFVFSLAFLTNQSLAQPAQPLRSPTDLKKLSFEELLDVEVISVSRRPEKLSETASAIQVITGEDIRRSGATSIPEALRLVSNLQVAQKTSRNWGITARGFNTDLANKLLVLIDGRTVYTPLYSGVFWDKQDYLLEDIDRIEVISGPGGTLWGANAVNGVINIITKSAEDSKGLYAEGGGGSIERGYTGLRYGAGLGANTNFRLYGKYFRRDGGEYANGSEATDAWRMGQSGFRADGTAGANGTFTLQGDYYDGTEDQLTGGTADISGYNVLSRWTHAATPGSVFTLQLYYDRTHLSTPTSALIINDIEFAPAGKLVDDLDTYDFDFQHSLELGKRNHTVWGLGYRRTHDVLENSPALAFYPATLNQDLFSGFLQNEIMLASDIDFTLGAKVEHNDYTGWEFEPNARVQWNLAPGQTIWGAISRAVRTPSRIDRDMSQPAKEFLVVLAGGHDFASETVIANELGYRLQLEQRLSASISSYYNIYDEVRSTSLTPATILPFFFENNLEGESYGLELTARYQVVDWWRARLGYSFLRTILRIKEGQYDLNNALNENADPRHQLSFGSSIDIGKRIELDGTLRWIEQLHNNNGPNQGEVPSYFELDCRIGWAPVDHLEISIVGRNLLHERHPEYGYPSEMREQIPRSIYGEVACRF